MKIEMEDDFLEGLKIRLLADCCTQSFQGAPVKQLQIKKSLPAKDIWLEAIMYERN
jgi:hypothetical protein